MEVIGRCIKDFRGFHPHFQGDERAEYHDIFQSVFFGSCKAKLAMEHLDPDDIQCLRHSLGMMKSAERCKEAPRWLTKKLKNEVCKFLVVSCCC